MGRRSKKSDDLFGVILVGAVITFAVMSAYPKFFIFCLLTIIVCGIVYIWYKIKSKRFKAYDISYIDNMDPFAFEEYICKLYKELGYNQSYCTPKSGDYGADVIAENKCEKIAIQVKRNSLKKTTGITAVQEVVAAKSFYGATRCAVVTTSYFTKNAKIMAKRCNVELIDRHDLKSMIIQISK